MFTLSQNIERAAAVGFIPGIHQYDGAVNLSPPKEIIIGYHVAEANYGSREFNLDDLTADNIPDEMKKIYTVDLNFIATIWSSNV